MISLGEYVAHALKRPMCQSRHYGKLAHPDRAQAETHRLRLCATTGRNKSGLETYQCAACGHWFVGHTRTRTRQEKTS